MSLRHVSVAISWHFQTIFFELLKTGKSAITKWETFFLKAIALEVACFPGNHGGP
jgi:hypothetical protein